MFPQTLTLNQHRYYVPFLIFHTSRFRTPLFYLHIFIMQFVFSPFPHYQRLNAFFPFFFNPLAIRRCSPQFTFPAATHVRWQFLAKETNQYNV